MKLALIYIFITVTWTKKIVDLPDLDFKIYSDQYSGYLNVSKTHRLFYWFFESQNTPSADPLVFWFNGGPMCSSLLGLFMEHGPFLLAPENSTFRRNEHTWNRISNMVYIESPAGVGYSYSTDGKTTTNDDLTADENYVAIKEFLKEFPQFRDHDIFLTGESYAGTYIPMLADRIIDGQKDYRINLKGIAIGNGCLSESIIQKTSWLYGYSHGLVDESTYQPEIERCCDGNLDTCEFDSKKKRCFLRGYAPYYEFNKAIDTYDISRLCYPPDVTNRSRQHTPCDEFFEPIGITYLNSVNVRKILGIPENVQTWKLCVSPKDKPYTKNRPEKKWYVQKIVNNGIRVLIYYGDQDIACDFLMGQRFAAGLGFKKLASKTPWYFKNVVAGYKTIYEGLTFATIRGASHSPPTTHPKEMFYFIQQFFNDKDF